MNHIKLFEDYIPKPPVSRKRELYNKHKNKTITPEEEVELKDIMDKHFAAMDLADAERKSEEERREKEANEYLQKHNNRINSQKFRSDIHELIHTSKFKLWFGDWETAHRTKDYSKCSKMVGANGEPLLLYHATKHEWNEYDITKVKSSTHDMGSGVYFSDNKNIDTWINFVDTDIQNYPDSVRIPTIKKPLFANIRNLKIVRDGYTDYEESGMDDNETIQYDGKIEGIITDINQGIVFNPKNVKFL